MTSYRILNCPYTLFKLDSMWVLKNEGEIIDSGKQFKRLKTKFDELTEPYKKKNAESFNEKPLTPQEEGEERRFNKTKLFWEESYKYSKK